MKNKLSDLNNHLFAQLERLSNEDLKGDDLRTEIERGKAISRVAGNIINSAKVTVDAIALVAKGSINKDDLPLMLSDKKQ